MRVFLCALALLVVSVAQNYDADVVVGNSEVAEAENAVMLFTAFLTSNTNLSPDVVLGYSTVVGTAGSNDFEVSIDDSVTFDTLAQSSSGYSATELIEVKISNDDVQEAVETFEIEYYIANAAEYGGLNVNTNPQIAIGTITDFEDVTVDLMGDNRTEGTDQGFTFSIKMSHKIDTDIRVSYSTLTGTAVSGVDFESALDQTIIFEAMNNDVSTFDVAILNDDVQESIETFEVQINYSPSVDGDRQLSFVPPTRSMQGRFMREVEGVTVCITSENAMVEEGTEKVDFVLSLSHYVDTDIEVPYLTTAGDDVSPMNAAHPDVEFSSFEYTHKFKSGTRANHTITIPVKNDNIQSAHANDFDLEDFGRLNFNIEYEVSPELSAFAIGGAQNMWNIAPCGVSDHKAAVKGYIYDFEDVTITLDAAVTIQSETSGSAFDFTVSMSHPVDAGKGNARGATYYYVNYNNVILDDEDTARVETDTPFQGCSSISTNVRTMPDVCWPVGVYPAIGSVTSAASSVNWDPLSSDLVKTLSMAQSSNDFLIEGTETFEIGIALTDETSSGYRIKVVGEDKVSLSITDDECSTDCFLYDHYPLTNSLPEDATESTFLFSTTLTHSSKRDVYYTWSVDEVSATLGEDFTAQTPFTLKWDAFGPKGLPKVAELKIKNDNLQELTEEFSISFDSIEPASLFSDVAVHVISGVKITDDEDMTVSITSMITAEDESHPEWLFTVHLSHQSSTDISIPYSGQQVVSNDLDRIAVEGFRWHASENQGAAIFQTGDQSEIISAVVVDDEIQTLNGGEQNFYITLNPINIDLINTAESELQGLVRVTDDEGVVVEVNGAAISETKSAVLDFEVVLSHQVTTVVEIIYDTLDGSATGSATGNALADGLSDYLQRTNALFTVPAMQTSSSIQVDVIDDVVQEISETFELVMVNLSPSIVNFKSTNNVLGVITDYEGISLSIHDYTNVESNSTWLFTVELSHRSSVDISVKYDLSYTGSARLCGGVSTENCDFNFVESTGNIVISSLTQVGEVATQIVDDNVAEMPETFMVRIKEAFSSEGIGGDFSVEGTFPNGIGTIGIVEDLDENPTVSVNQPASAARSDGSIDFEISLSHKVASDLEISYYTGDDTATGEDEDYTPTSGLVTFAAQNTAETVTMNTDPQVVTVDIAISVCQGINMDESFDFIVVRPAIFTSSKAENVLTSQGTMTFFDHSATVEVLDATAPEEDGGMISFDVHLSHCVSEPVVMNWITHAGSATSARYTVNGVQSFTFAAGIAADLDHEIEIALKNDDFQDLSKTFEVEIYKSGLSNVEVDVVNGRALGVITDDEGVTIDVTPCVIGDDTDPFVFSVTVSHMVETTINVEYVTEDGTAVRGTDYTPATGILALTTVLQITGLDIEVTPIEIPDVLRPGDGAIDVSSLNDTQLAQVAPPTRFYVDITASDPAVMEEYNIEFAHSQSSLSAKGAIIGSLYQSSLIMESVDVIEGETASLTVTITDDLAENITVQWTVTPSSKPTFEQVRADDFVGNSFPTGTLHFHAAAGGAQSATLDVITKDDFLMEMDEYFTIAFEVVSPEGFPTDALLTDGVADFNGIMNNDFATLLFVPSVGIESETDDMASTLEFTIALSHQIYTEVTASFVVSSSCDGTGGDGLACGVVTTPTGKDHTADFLLSNVLENVTFAAVTTSTLGVAGPFDAHFDIIIFNDDVQEKDEIIFVEMTSVTSVDGLEVPDSNAIEVIITDDEKAVWNVSNAFAEEMGTLTFEVTTSHSYMPSLTLFYTTVEDTALESIDYIPVSNSLVLSGNVMSASIDVEVLHNPIQTGDLQMSMRLIPEKGLQAPESGVGTIVMYDEKCTIGVSSPSVDEGGAQSWVSFAIELSHVVDTDVSVTFKTSGGSATGCGEGENVVNCDYTLLEEDVELEYGAPRNLVVYVHNDDVVEADETIELQVSIHSPDYPITVSPEVPFATIHDHEGAEIYVASSGITEGADSNMLFSVFLSHELEGSFGLVFNTKDGSAWSENVVGGVNSLFGKDFEPVVDGVSTEQFTTGYHDFDTNPLILEVHIVDDWVSEELETFHVEVVGMNPPDVYNVNVAGQNNLGFIGDAEFATISIENSKEISETIGLVEMEVVMSHFSQPDVVVSYRTVDTLATSSVSSELPYGLRNIDFIAQDGTLTFEGAFNDDGTEFTMGAGTRSQMVIVTIEDDHIQEPEKEEFCISLQRVVEPLNLDVSLDTAMSDGFIMLTDDSEFATIAVHAPPSPKAEGKNLQFDVSLSHNVQIVGRYGFDVEFSSISGTAVEGDDYELPESHMVTFDSSVSAGGQHKRITVGLLTDRIAEPQETFEIHLDGIVADTVVGTAGAIALSDSTLSLAVSSAMGVIAMGDPAVISIEEAPVTTEGFPIKWVLSISEKPDRLVVVNYAVTEVPGVASDLSDNSAMGQIAFGPDRSKTVEISVNTLDNDIVQAQRMLILLLEVEDPLVHVEIDTENTFGYVEDDDFTDVSIISTDVFEAEGAMLEFPVLFSLPVADEMLVSWTVRASTDDSSFADAVDYQDGAQAVAEFPAMQQEYHLNVPVFNDNVQENDETVVIQIDEVASRSGLIASSRFQIVTMQAEGTIHDMEGATVSIAESNSVPETTGNANNNFRFAVTLSHVTRINEAIDLIFTHETTSMADFSPCANADSDCDPATGRVSFSFPTDVDASEGHVVKNVLIGVTDDQISEKLHEVAHVELVAEGAKYTPVFSPDATFTIIDDDDATISLQSTEGEETAGSLSFNVGISHEVDIGISLTYSALNLDGPGKPPHLGKAFGSLSENRQIIKGSNGKVLWPDFVLVFRDELTFDVLETTSTIDVTLRDDNEQECDESFQVSIDEVTLHCGGFCSEYRVTMENNAATGHIVNDLEPGIGFQIEGPEDGYIMEGLTNFAFMLKLSHSVDRELSVAWSTSELVPPLQSTRVPIQTGFIRLAEHTSPLQESQVMYVGTASDSIPIQLTSDTVAQPAQELNVVITGVSYTQTSAGTCNLRLDGNYGASTQLLDDEVATISVSSVAYLEGAPYMIDVQLSHEVAVDVEASFVMAHVTTDAQDFDSTSFPVTFSFDGVAGDIQSYQVPVTDDFVIEADEFFALTFEGPEYLHMSDETISSSYTILNDDIATIHVAKNDAPEGNAFTFDLTLSHAADKEVTVTYTASGQPGEVGEGVQEISFEGLQAGEVVTGTITSSVDNIVELNETFSVALNVPDEHWYRGNEPFIGFDGLGDRFTGVVINNDFAFISSQDATAAEADGEITFVVSIDTPVDTDVIVYYVTERGTAEGGVDFAPVEGVFGSILFPAGMTDDISLSIEIQGNDGCEDTEVFMLRFVDIDASGRNVRFTGGALPYSVEGFIVNSDFPEISISTTPTGAGQNIEIIAANSKTCPFPIEVPVILGEDRPEGVSSTASCIINADAQTCIISIPTSEDTSQTAEISFGVVLDQSASSVSLIFSDVEIESVVRPAASVYVEFTEKTMIFPESALAHIPMALTSTYTEDIIFNVKVSEESTAKNGLHYLTTVSNQQYKIKAGQTVPKKLPSYAMIETAGVFMPQKTLLLEIELVDQPEDVGAGSPMTVHVMDRHIIGVDVSGLTTVAAGENFVLNLKPTMEIDTSSSLEVTMRFEDLSAKNNIDYTKMDTVTATFSSAAFESELVIPTIVSGLQTARQFQISFASDDMSFHMDPVILTITPTSLPNHFLFLADHCNTPVTVSDDGRTAILEVSSSKQAFVFDVASCFLNVGSSGITSYALVSDAPVGISFNNNGHLSISGNKLEETTRLDLVATDGVFTRGGTIEIVINDSAFSGIQVSSIYQLHLNDRLELSISGSDNCASLNTVGGSAVASCLYYRNAMHLFVDAHFPGFTTVTLDGADYHVYTAVNTLLSMDSHITNTLMGTPTISFAGGVVGPSEVAGINFIDFANSDIISTTPASSGRVTGAMVKVDSSSRVVYGYSTGAAGPSSFYPLYFNFFPETC